MEVLEGAFPSCPLSKSRAAFRLTRRVFKGLICYKCHIGKHKESYIISRSLLEYYWVIHKESKLKIIWTHSTNIETGQVSNKEGGFSKIYGTETNRVIFFTIV